MLIKKDRQLLLFTELGSFKQAITFSHDILAFATQGDTAALICSNGSVYRYQSDYLTQQKITVP